MTYTLIGFGNMGLALFDGLGKTHQGRVVEPKADRRDLAQSRGAAVFSSLSREALEGSDAVILAIKPQDSGILAEHRELLKDFPIISILAGTTTARITEITGSSQVVRLMPSLAAAVGAAVVGVSSGEGSENAVTAMALAVAEALGRPFEIPERLMPAITGLSGSGIAFVYAFVHAMALGGTKAGIPYATSVDIAFELLKGAYESHKASGEAPMETVTRVCSPAGTTINGIQTLAEHNFDAALIAAVNAAAERAGALEG
jgi:pyrroline-5-carboxylate reductase